MADRVSSPIRSISRRHFLRAVGVAGTAVGLSGTLWRGRALAQTQEVKADPSVKRGGTLRYGVHNAPAHFDVHQSGTVANIGPQSPMYDTLLRRDPGTGRPSSRTWPGSGRSRPTARSTRSTSARA